jgi:hypothetical protein
MLSKYKINKKIKTNPKKMIKMNKYMKKIINRILY